jgi:hypothetical protein
VALVAKTGEDIRPAGQTARRVGVSATGEIIPTRVAVIDELNHTTGLTGGLPQHGGSGKNNGRQNT